MSTTYLGPRTMDTTNGTDYVPCRDGFTPPTDTAYAPDHCIRCGLHRDDHPPAEQVACDSFYPLDTGPRALTCSQCGMPRSAHTDPLMPGQLYAADDPADVYLMADAGGTLDHSREAWRFANLPPGARDDVSETGLTIHPLTGDHETQCAVYANGDLVAVLDHAHPHAPALIACTASAYACREQGSLTDLANLAAAQARLGLLGWGIV